MDGMSPSPPMDNRRSFSLERSNSQSSSKHEEELINAYEAEQERIMNVLSRKLEQLRNEKVDLENALEAENESHVLRLQRELAALRAQQLAQAQQAGTSEYEPVSPTAGGGEHVDGEAERDKDNATPGPSVQTMLDALRRENESLRARLHDTERDYIRVSRLNDTYREELLDLRRRLNLPVDSLLAPSSSPSLHPVSQSPSLSPIYGFSPLSPRSRAGSLSMPHPHTGGGVGHTTAPHHRGSGHHSHHPSTGSSTHGPPPSAYIPVPSSQDSPSPSSTPSSTSALTLSPMSSLFASSLPPSSSRLTPSSSPAFYIPAPSTTPAWGGLTYPSVPPPSLSSSVGSAGSPARGGGMMMMAGPSANGERGRGQGRRVVETGTLRRAPSSSASPAGQANTHAVLAPTTNGVSAPYSDGQ